MPGPASLPHRLRDALVAADFTYDAVADLLGPSAHAALGRNETTPGLRRTGDASPLATLTRLFLLQARVDERAADRALAGLLDALAAAGFLDRSGGEVMARLDVRPYAADGVDLWVVSDLTPGLDGAPSRSGTDHVLGISPAATSLAQLTVREPVGRRARPRNRLRGAVAAPRDARRPRRRDRRERARTLGDVVQPRVERRAGRSGRRAIRLVLRARRPARRSTSSPPTRRSSSPPRRRNGWSIATRGCPATGPSSTSSPPRRTTCDQGAGARCSPTGSWPGTSHGTSV